MTDTMTSRSDSRETRNAPGFELGSAVGKIARQMHPDNVGKQPNALSRGDLAELRRAGPGAGLTSTFWRVLADVGQIDEPRRLGSPDREHRWAVLLSGMAYCAGLHDYGTSLGMALARAGWSELRFVRLMRAEGETLEKEIRRVAQYLASKSQEANWAEVASLLFYQHGETAEKVRLRIAKRYYRTLHEQSS